MSRAARLIAAWTLALSAAGGAFAAAPPDCPAAVAAPGVPSAAPGSRAARDHGFLWRISKDGRDSYLFGSLHVARAQWAVAGPALRAALNDADTLALELDVSDPAVARQLAVALGERAHGLKPDAASSRRLQRQRALACVDDAATRSQPALLQAIGLTLSAARRIGLDADFAPERVLSDAARAAHKPIVSLETARRQADLLLPEDPVLARTMLLDTLSQLESGSTQRTLERLATAWAGGDLHTLQRYAQWCECADSAAQRALLRRLIDDRNPPLAAAIEQLHRDGHRVLAVVGALHMVGASGLPALLAQRGYVVQRVVFHDRR